MSYLLAMGCPSPRDARSPPKPRASGTVLLSPAFGRRPRRPLIRTKRTPARPGRGVVSAASAFATLSTRTPARVSSARAPALVAQWTEHAPPKRGMQVRLLPGASRPRTRDAERARAARRLRDGRVRLPRRVHARMHDRPGRRRWRAALYRLRRAGRDGRGR